DGIRLFQSLFVLVAAVDWKWFDKSRALIAYFAGVAAVVVANCLRISLLVILGNRDLTNWVIRQHGNAGWVVFTMAFLGFLWFAYPWILRRSVNGSYRNGAMGK